MSKLSTGKPASFPRGWGFPSPVMINGRRETGGMVWHGSKPATQADIEALEDYFAWVDTVSIDEASLVGRDDPNYSNFYLDNRHLSKQTVNLW